MSGKTVRQQATFIIDNVG